MSGCGGGGGGVVVGPRHGQPEEVKARHKQARHEAHQGGQWQARIDLELNVEVHRRSFNHPPTPILIQL